RRHTTSKRDWRSDVCSADLYRSIQSFQKYTTLSAGTASASSEEGHFLWGLQTRAVPAGVSYISLLHIFIVRFFNSFNYFCLSGFLYLTHCLCFCSISSKQCVNTSSFIMKLNALFFFTLVGNVFKRTGPFVS